MERMITIQELLVTINLTYCRMWSLLLLLTPIEEQCHYFGIFILYIVQWRVYDFINGKWVAIPKVVGGQPIIFTNFFPRNCMKMEKNGRERVGVGASIVPLGSANAVSKN